MLQAVRQEVATAALQSAASEARLTNSAFAASRGKASATRARLTEKDKTVSIKNLARMEWRCWRYSATRRMVDVCSEKGSTISGRNQARDSSFAGRVGLMSFEGVANFAADARRSETGGRSAGCPGQRSIVFPARQSRLGWKNGSPAGNSERIYWRARS